MTTKFKILSAISFIALAIALTFVGVWALADLNFTVGGNIEYTAPEPQSGYTVGLIFSDGSSSDIEYSVNGGEYTPISHYGKIDISSVETISFKKVPSVSHIYYLGYNGELIEIQTDTPISFVLTADTTIAIYASSGH